MVGYPTGNSDVSSNGEYEAVIGLEVHAQMRTLTKAFCGCRTEFGMDPNSSVCPVCLGLPGSLPVLNRNLVSCAVAMGIATGCEVAPRTVFARKNYFYPDLPKGYQISQYEEPICTEGALEIDDPEGGRKRIGIARIHMEEDAGKSLHDLDVETLVDLNRCGVPLIEIVTKPDLRSPREASLFLAEIRRIVTYLGICDGNMEEGSLRCDANVSVRRRGEVRFGKRTEVKNMNSFRNVERALEYEIERQTSLIEDGVAVEQETLLWDADRNVAFPMRGKEGADDYRYFPDPDLVPLEVADSWIAEVRGSMPELPAIRRDRFQVQLGLPRYDAEVLTSEKEIADYFEETLAHLAEEAGGEKAPLAKIASNWVMTEVLRVAGGRKASFPVSPRRLASLLSMVRDGSIGGSTAKDVFAQMMTSDEDPRSIVGRRGLQRVTDRAVISGAVAEVLSQHPQQVRMYQEGKGTLMGFFVGETMKATGGRADPSIVKEILGERLTKPGGSRTNP